MLFRDRTDAGRQLGRRIAGHRELPDAIVLALPRGGVPVGFEVARELGAPLDVFLVRKLGVPWYPELAIGAIASGGVLVLNDAVVDALGIGPEQLGAVVRTELTELQRRERAYRGGRPPPEVRGRTALLVDDGLATGSTMRAAVTALRDQQPRRIVVAVPVGSPDACAELQGEADELICLHSPELFRAVGDFYRDFSQTTDDEVRELLRRAEEQLPAAASAQRPDASS